MRRVAFAALIGVCVGTWAVAAPEGANRIPNGDIRTVEGEKPADWSTYVGAGSSPVFAVEDQGDPRGRVLRLQADNEKAHGFWVSSAVPVTPGERLTVSALVRSAMQSGSAALCLGFRGADRLAFGIRDVAGITGTTGWVPFAATVVVPEGAETAYMTLGLRTGNVGTIWGDDFCIVPCPLQVATVSSSWGAGNPGRLLRFTLKPAVALSGKLKVELALEGDAAVQSLQVQADGKAPIPVSFRTARLDALRTCLRVRSAEGALLAAEQMDAPPVMDVSLGEASYRRTLFVSKGSPRTLEGSVALQVEPALLRTLALRIALLPQDKDVPLASHEARVKGDRAAFRLDLSRVLAGAYRLRFALSSGKAQVAKVEQPFTLREDGPHTVRVDGHNSLLIGGKPFFPHGVYGGAPPEELPRIKAGGFNSLFTYDTDPVRLRKLLDKAQEVGLYVMASAPIPFAKRLPAQAEKLREVVHGLKEHPALLGWYLYDEPDGQGVPAATVRALHDVVAQEDPDHPTWVVFDKPDAFRHYAGVCDVFMVDPYPLLEKRHPLTKVSDWVETARAAVQDRQPVVAVPQAFGWEKAVNVPKVSYRTPTAEEYRLMAFLALAHGSRGLASYIYHVITEYDASKPWPFKPGGYLPDLEPALWGGMTGVAAEVNALAPALLWADRRPFVEGGIHGIRLRRGAKETVILTNPGEEPVPIPSALRQGMRVAGAEPPAVLGRYGVLVLER